MYLFTSAFVSNIEEQKCEKDIEQDISSNATKMCVCRKLVLKLDTTLLLKVWDLIRDLLLEDFRFQRKLYWHCRFGI